MSGEEGTTAPVAASKERGLRCGDRARGGFLCEENSEQLEARKAVSAFLEQCFPQQYVEFSEVGFLVSLVGVCVCVCVCVCVHARVCMCMKWWQPTLVCVRLRCFARVHPFT
jgi:hypothetical protein